jgi:hypothetical protein
MVRLRKLEHHMSKPAKFEFPPKFDALSKSGAAVLAECIMKAWVNRGYGNVVARRFPIADTASWGVESNLVNGLPPARVRRSG